MKKNSPTGKERIEEIRKFINDCGLSVPPDDVIVLLSELDRTRSALQRAREALEKIRTLNGEAMPVKPYETFFTADEALTDISTVL